MIIVPKIIEEYAEELKEYYNKAYPPVAEMAKLCFLNTISTTICKCDNPYYFVITGDIPAMWLRDSSAQIKNYIPFASMNKSMQEIIEGVIASQAKYVLLDPYANAFNAKPNKNGFQDITEHNEFVWERKYEVDSLCAPIYTVYEYWKATKKATIFTPSVHKMIQKIVSIFTLEQNHENSLYSFQRKNCPPKDTLVNNGKGTHVTYTGMTWSGFRPSDDSCKYGYLIPSNMMAYVALQKAKKICAEVYSDNKLADKCDVLANEINNGINKYGIINHPVYGDIYAYETDGLGNYNLMDDANSPSLLSIPYIGYCSTNNNIYNNTRRFILSSDNPYYFKGKYAQGIGSPHTPQGYVWNISIIMQALTSENPCEIKQCVEMLANTHDNSNYMHESFNPDNPNEYTRPWFAWANTLFAQLLIQLKDRNFTFDTF